LASSLYIKAWRWVLPGRRKEESSLPSSPSQWKLVNPQQNSQTHDPPLRKPKKKPEEENEKIR
jgi:hypothetical protein